MKLTKTKLKEMIKEELNELQVDATNARAVIFDLTRDAIYRLGEALLNIKSFYGKTAEYKELEKASKLVDKWYRKWK
tara:strand:+ start:329 stop:559 length:231 start_codon:yes stop_codon:yes gene_type:complete